MTGKEKRWWIRSIAAPMILLVGVFVSGLIVISDYDPTKYYGINNHELGYDYVPQELEWLNHHVYIHNYTNEEAWGEYYEIFDRINLYEGRDDFTLVHELGHRLHAKLQRKLWLEWETISKNDNHTISNYALKDSGEDFAETFECWWAPQNYSYSTMIGETAYVTKDCRILLKQISPERHSFFEKIKGVMIGEVRTGS